MTDIAVDILDMLEIVGTIAFSISGALVAIGAGLDIFGVLFIGAVTAFGGGILRDLLVGINPPASFSNLSIWIISMAVSTTVFVIAYIRRKNFNMIRERIEHINNYFDAVGLAVFSVMGSEVAFLTGFSRNPFIVIVLGMITGIGGGIFRDIMTDTTPYVFKKHIYALASIAGSAIYYILRRYTGNVTVATALPAFLVVLIRVLASRYRWSLPKINLTKENDNEL